MSKVFSNKKKQFILDSDDDSIDSSDSDQEFPEDDSNSDFDESSESSEDYDQLSELRKMKEVIIFPKNKKNNNIIPTSFKPPMPAKISQIPIPSIGGVNLQTTNKAPVILKKYNNKEIDLITKNMPGINIGKEYKTGIRFDISDLLEKEAAESIKDFQIRKEITVKISNINDPKISDMSSVILGLMITKKLKYGIKYEENVEFLITYLMRLMK